MPKTDLPVVRPLLDRVRRLEQDRLRLESLKARVRLDKLRSNIKIQSVLLLKPDLVIDETPCKKSIEDMLWADAACAVESMDLLRPAITPFSSAKEKIRVLYDWKDQDPKTWPEPVKKAAIALRPEGLPLNKKHRLRTLINGKRVYFSLPSLTDILVISVI